MDEAKTVIKRTKKETFKKIQALLDEHEKQLRDNMVRVDANILKYHAFRVTEVAHPMGLKLVAFIDFSLNGERITLQPVIEVGFPQDPRRFHERVREEIAKALAEILLSKLATATVKEREVRP